MNQENQPEVNQSTVSSEQSTVSTTTPSTVHRSPNSFLVILLSILLLISCVIAGFFAFQTQKLVAEVTGYREQLKQTLIPTTNNLQPSVTPDPTANWKTYTNTKYNFSFRYPSNFGNEGAVSGPYSIKSSDSVGIMSFSDPDTIREGTDAPFDGFSIYYVEDLNAQSFEEFLSNEKTSMDNAAYASMTGAKRILLDNKGVAFVNDTRGYYYYPLNGNKNVLVLAYIQKNNNFRSIFNQILSTFKFTN